MMKRHLKDSNETITKEGHKLPLAALQGIELARQGNNTPLRNYCRLLQKELLRLRNEGLALSPKWATSMLKYYGGVLDHCEQELVSDNNLKKRG